MVRKLDKIAKIKIKSLNQIMIVILIGGALVGVIFSAKYIEKAREAIKTSEIVDQSEISESEEVPESLHNIENVPVEDDNEGSEDLKREEADIEKDVAEINEARKKDEAEEKLETAAIEQAEIARFTEKLKTPEKAPEGSELKIGFITDLHLISRPEGQSRVFLDEYYERLDYFLRKMNDDFVPNFILVDGDEIEGTRVPSEIGSQELSLCKSFFDRTDIPKYWVLGNHDLRSVTKTQWENSLGIGYNFGEFSVGDYQIFILDSNFTSEGAEVSPSDGYDRGNISEEQLDWLRTELKKTSKKKIVFLHHAPVWDHSKEPNSNMLRNARELRGILAENGVLAVFAGHIEELFQETVDGVNYFVFPGLKKQPQYQGAFVEISLGEDTLMTKMFYLASGKKQEYKSMKMLYEF